jgi:peptidyl-prolyl cis-trans isomerase SurA
VPSLADVPQGSAAASSAAAPSTGATALSAAAPATGAASSSSTSSAQVASTKAPTQKPGKKEKIRFGQAPRETLPTAETKSEDAGANTSANTTGDDKQVASSNTPSDLKTLNPDGSVASPDQPTDRKVKTRFSARAKEPKAKKDKNDPFAPPPATTDELATQQQQAKPLGLNGDTSKQKKPNTAKTGPKRRMTDEKKDKDQAQPANGDNGAPAAAPATPPAAAPAQTPAPAPQPAPTQP